MYLGINGIKSYFAHIERQGLTQFYGVPLHSELFLEKKRKSFLCQQHLLLYNNQESLNEGKGCLSIYILEKLSTVQKLSRMSSEYHMKKMQYSMNV